MWCGTKLAAAVYNGNIWMSTDSGANWAGETHGKHASLVEHHDVE